MLSLMWPWLLWLLPLPLLYRWLIKPIKNALPALRVPAQQYSQETSNNEGRQIKQVARLFLLLLCWIALILAATRPTWVGEPIALPTNARDLLLAVDISGSMEKYEDMALNGKMVSRLVAVKSVVSEFVQRRTGDRLGLILFGSQPYLQVPLTFDKDTLNQLLIEAQAGFAGNQTAFGDAIGLAVKRLIDRPAEQRVLILLTDGVNNAGNVMPLQAAELAAKENIRIYTIGVGADSMVVRDLIFSRKINPSADLDEKTLQQIADMTGGQYFRARNPQELNQIYQLLDQLEPVEQEAETLRPTKALFYWPLGFCLIATLVLVLFSRRAS